MRTISHGTTRLTTAEAVTLGLLAEEKERSGYDLLKRAEGSVGHIWLPAKSQLYATLPRLVDAGLARRRDVRQERRPDKQVYRLTADGKQSLRTWLEHPMPRSWDELLLKVFFARFASAEALLVQLDEYRQRQEAELEEYLAIERAIAGEPGKRHGYLTLRYGIALMRSRLAWLDAAAQELSV
jgi:DNA-binding PadR family transcriptional regulator